MRRLIAIVTVVSVIFLAMLLVTTTPSTAGPLVILGFFVFLYFAALGVLTFLFHSLGSVVSRAPFMKKGRAGADRVSFKSAYYHASVIALVPVMLIAIQSVSQIGVYQILLVCFFAVVAWIYITNRTT